MYPTKHAFMCAPGHKAVDALRSAGALPVLVALLACKEGQTAGNAALAIGDCAKLGAMRGRNEELGALRGRNEELGALRERNEELGALRGRNEELGVLKEARSSVR